MDFQDFKKVISLLVVFTFSVSGITPPKPVFAATPELSSSSLLKLEQLRINPEIASLEERFQGASGKTVIAIQDAHGSYDAQKNIRALIQVLQDQYGFKLVALEGGEGRADHTIFRTFPDHESNARQADRFLKLAELSGGEAAAILNPKRGIFYGVEDRQLYFQNRNSFLKALELRNANSHTLQLLGEKLDKIARKIFPQDLLRFHQAEREFLDHPEGLAEFLQVLKRFPYESYPNLSLLFGANAKNEKEILSKIEGRRLFEEIRNFSGQIKQNWYDKAPGIAQLDELFGKLRMLENLSALEITRTDYVQFLAHRQEFDFDIFTGFLAQYGDSIDLKLDLVPALEFYEDAVRRDQALYRNLIQAMQKEGESRAVLVTGGFHTEGLRGEFRKEGISYLIFSPHIREIEPDNPYFKVMAGRVSYRSSIQMILQTMGLEAHPESFMQAYFKGGLEEVAKSADAHLDDLERKWRANIIRVVKEESVIEDPGDLIRLAETLIRQLAGKSGGRKRIERILDTLGPDFTLSRDSRVKKKVEKFVGLVRERLLKHDRLTLKDLDDIFERVNAVEARSLGLEDLKRQYPYYGFLLDELAKPDSIGEEILVATQAGCSPSIFRNLLTLIQRYRKNFDRMMSSKFLGLETMRYVFRHDPAGLSDFLSLHARYASGYLAIRSIPFLSLETIRAAFRSNVQEFAHAMKILAEKDHQRIFEETLARLISEGADQDLFIFSFIYFPSDVIEAILFLGEHWDELKPYWIERYQGIDLTRLLRDRNMRVILDTYATSTLNAARGWIDLMGIRPGDKTVLISYRDEVTGPEVKKRLPDYASVHNAKTSGYAGAVELRFVGDRGFKVEQGLIMLPLSPFKFHLPSELSGAEKHSIRQAMKLSSGRHLIVAASPDESELKEVLEAYRKFELRKRPLLILGLAKPDRTLREKLAAEKIRVQNRTESDRKRPGWQAGKRFFSDLDIVILNTRGELFELIQAADLALVGSDRNLFEPASQGVPILYFEGDWQANRIPRQLLDESGGAQVILPGGLREQIGQVLARPKPMREGTQAARRQFQTRVLPAAKFYSSILVAKSILAGSQAHAQSLGAEPTEGSLAMRLARGEEIDIPRDSQGQVDLRQLLVPHPEEIPQGKALKAEIREYIESYLKDDKKTWALANLEDSRLLPYMERARQFNIFLIVSRPIKDEEEFRKKFIPYFETLIKILDEIPPEMIWELTDPVGWEVAKTDDRLMGFQGTSDTQVGGGAGMTIFMPAGGKEAQLTDSSISRTFDIDQVVSESPAPGGKFAYDEFKLKETVVHELLGHKRSITKRPQYEIKNGRIKKNPGAWDLIMDRASWQAAGQVNGLKSVIPFTPELKEAIEKAFSMMTANIELDLDRLPQDPQKLLDLLRKLYQMPFGYYADLLELVAFSTQDDDLSQDERNPVSGKMEARNKKHQLHMTRDVLEISNARLGIPVDPDARVYLAHTYSRRLAQEGKFPYESHYLMDVGTASSPIWQQVRRQSGKWVNEGEPILVSQLSMIPAKPLPAKIAKKLAEAVPLSSGERQKMIRHAVKLLLELLNQDHAQTHFVLDRLTREDLETALKAIRVKRETGSSPGKFEFKRALIEEALVQAGLSNKKKCADSDFEILAKGILERVPTQEELNRMEPFIIELLQGMIDLKDLNDHPLFVTTQDILGQISTLKRMRQGIHEDFFLGGPEVILAEFFKSKGFGDAEKFTDEAAEYLIRLLARRWQTLGGYRQMADREVLSLEPEEIFKVSLTRPSSKLVIIRFQRIKDRESGESKLRILVEIPSRGELREKVLSPGESVMIGRDPRIDFPLAISQVSRTHLKVSFDSQGQKVTLQNQGPANGTYLSRRPSISDLESGLPASASSLGDKRETVLHELAPPHGPPSRLTRLLDRILNISPNTYLLSTLLLSLIPTLSYFLAIDWSRSHPFFVLITNFFLLNLNFITTESILSSLFAYKTVRYLPGIDVTEGIPESQKAVVFYPILARSAKDLKFMEETLAPSMEKNPDPNAVWVIVSCSDPNIAELERARVKKLQKRFGKSRVVYLHRDPRIKNWERKRGSYMHLMSWARNGAPRDGVISPDSRFPSMPAGKVFDWIEGDVTGLAPSVNLLVGDSDTIWPEGSVKTFVSKIAHPANREFGIFQGRIYPHNYNESFITRIFEYTFNLFGRQVFAHWNALGQVNFLGHSAGWNMDTFLDRIAGKMSEGYLSHDIVESYFIKTAFVAEAFTYEETPPDLLRMLRQVERWWRGNKIASRLFLPYIPDETGRLVGNRGSWVNQFLIYDADRIYSGAFIVVYLLAISTFTQMGYLISSGITWIGTAFLGLLLAKFTVPWFIHNQSWRQLKLSLVAFLSVNLIGPFMMVNSAWMVITSFAKDVWSRIVRDARRRGENLKWIPQGSLEQKTGFVDIYSGIWKQHLLFLAFFGVAIFYAPFINIFVWYTLTAMILSPFVIWYTARPPPDWMLSGQAKTVPMTWISSQRWKRLMERVAAAGVLMLALSSIYLLMREPISSPLKVGAGLRPAQPRKTTLAGGAGLRPAPTLGPTAKPSQALPIPSVPVEAKVKRQELAVSRQAPVLPIRETAQKTIREIFRQKDLMKPMNFSKTPSESEIQYWTARNLPPERLFWEAQAWKTVREVAEEARYPLRTEGETAYWREKYRNGEITRTQMVKQFSRLARETGDFQTTELVRRQRGVEVRPEDVEHVRSLALLAGLVDFAPGEWSIGEKFSPEMTDGDLHYWAEQRLTDLEIKARFEARARAARLAQSVKVVIPTQSILSFLADLLEGAQGKALYSDRQLEEELLRVQSEGGYALKLLEAEGLRDKPISLEQVRLLAQDRGLYTDQLYSPSLTDERLKGLYEAHAGFTGAQWMALLSSLRVVREMAESDRRMIREFPDYLESAEQFRSKTASGKSMGLGIKMLFRGDALSFLAAQLGYGNFSGDRQPIMEYLAQTLRLENIGALGEALYQYIANKFLPPVRTERAVPPKIWTPEQKLAMKEAVGEFEEALDQYAHTRALEAWPRQFVTHVGSLPQNEAELAEIFDSAFQAAPKLKWRIYYSDSRDPRVRLVQAYLHRLKVEKKLDQAHQIELKRKPRRDLARVFKNHQRKSKQEENPIFIVPDLAMTCGVREALVIELRDEEIPSEFSFVKRYIAQALARLPLDEASFKFLEDQIGLKFSRDSESQQTVLSLNIEAFIEKLLLSQQAQQKVRQAA